MTLTLQMINVDCTDVAAQAGFWSQALGVPVDENDGNAFMRTVGYDRPTLPRMMFLAVPEGKTAKNRMHLDLVADDRAAEVSRLVALGATELRDHDEWGIQWTVLTDPEGNEFCVASAAGH